MEEIMFKATQRVLALSLALAAGAAPASARLVDLNAGGSYVAAGSVGSHVLRTSPRGVAINLGQAQSASPVVRRKAAEQMSPTSTPRRGRDPESLDGRGTPYPGTTVTRYPGVVPGSTRTQYPGVIPGSTRTQYPGVIPNTGAPTTVPAVATTGGGFDWGDGAIGALVVLGVMTAGFGATVLVRRRADSLARTNSLARTEH
jgi:hypothetical protein